MGSSFGEGVAAVQPPRPLLWVPPWLRFEEQPAASGVPLCGRELSKRTPALWQDWCLRLGGRNLYGEPLLRIVWSEEQTVLVGGVWSRFDDHGNYRGEELGYRPFKKYPGIEERWLLEMWMAPETFGGPEAWQTRHEKLTPWGEKYLVLPVYPSRGDYWSIATFTEPETGDYSEPTWSDLPGLFGVQEAWKAKDPLERFYELDGMTVAQKRAADADVLEHSAEFAGRTRAETMAELGIRTRVSYAGLEAPRRSDA